MNSGNREAVHSGHTFVRQYPKRDNPISDTSDADRWSKWFWKDGNHRTIAIDFWFFKANSINQTIIETLKYATTGELPPNSKGGAFIHDPKICREREVLAQVKLQFRASTGARMVATRNLQLTVKKTTRQQKTLEGNLLMVKDGQRSSISTRVAELDKILPQYLGVSKAILESVIFCHQEDSLWPMSEPSVLKKKFDDIFEASKYTKAIDNIKALRKKQNELLSNYKIMEQHAKENKDRADKAKSRALTLSNEIEVLRKECTDLTKQMEQAAEAADKAWRESESYAEVLGKLSGSRVEAQSIQNSIDRLKEHLVEVDESDEWLEATLREFHSRQEKLHQGEETLKRRYLNLQREMEGLRQKGGSAQAKVGAHKKDREHYELQIVRRQDLVKSIARQNSLRGFENQLDDQSFTEFMSAIERLARERKDALNRAKEAAQVELGQVQSVLNELEKKKSGLDEAKKLAKRQIIQNNREAEKCQNQLNDIDVDEGRKVTLQSRAQETERALSQAKESAKATSWETKIGEKAAELQRQEDINARLNTELITATERAGDLARLDLLKQELKDRERSLETMTHTHNDRLKELLGREWEPSTLEKIFQERQREANQDLYSAERDRDGISRDLDQIEDKLKVTKQSLREDQSEARQLAEKITEVISDEPSAFPAVLSAREEQLSNAKEEADIFFGRNKYFEMCIQTAEEKNACRTCMRKFKTGEAQNLIAKLQKWIQEGTAQNIRDFEEDVQAAKNLSSDYERWSRLTSHEIPASEKEIKGLESQRGPLVAEAEKHDKKVLDCTEFKRELESLSKTVSSIARYEGEIVMFKKQIEELSGKQQTGSGRTLTEIREEITTVADVIRALQRDIEQLKQSRQESQNEVNILELRLRDTNSDLNEVLHQLEKQSSIASQIEGYKHKNSELRESIAASDKEIDELLPEIINTQAKYDDISSRADARRSELEKQVSQISENIFQINMASQDINSYIERGGDRQLEEAEMQLVSINSDIAELERQQGELTKEINQLTSEIQDSKNTERKYSDNLQYRQLQTKLQEVNQVIDSLSSQNAEVDRDRFVRESEKWSRRHTTLSALYNR
ncbi:DNA repair protein Rad50 [Ascosphaera apis ARSEF 7405]|uniref:DNA repair protein RAD50 n=1 Tax=Ascosphaera apis ARSEF 7405 TaxID=392613 RepID=A0A168BTP6_9EURO|nr:DNA repair protein Rad50 [Ascosphaera apis ARSEF 7405]